MSNLGGVLDHPVHDGFWKQLVEFVSVEIELAPASFQEGKAVGDATGDVCRHQHELDIARGILIATVAPQIAEGHGIVGGGASGKILEEVMQPIGQRQNAGTVGPHVARARAEPVAVFRQSLADVAEHAERHAEDRRQQTEDERGDDQHRVTCAAETAPVCRP